MTVAEIISLARNQTGGTTISQISDAQMLIYLNIVYQDIFSAIAETDKKQTRQQRTADTVAGQSEYTLPIENDTGTEPGLKRLLNLYIKYKSEDTYYRKLRVLDYEDFQASSDVLEEYETRKTQSSDDWENREFPYPFVVRADTVSIFVNPAPSESVTWGLKIQGTYIPLDLAADGESADIKVDKEYHDLIALGIEQYVRGFRQIDSKRNIAMNRYAVEKQNMISQMTNVVENAKQGVLPEADLYFYA